ncbi:MAG: tRNA (adenosine(37)-N6)-threonylcarbamoyltransferase complex transferase subunit TsaD [Holosporaceae bacterium]|jgi:N6-L-threonylcarbamoyladenine synthase|nr:tRNA (adenosine(37)-N6)-threonylcarbamoyltransferase complex transferase subunit TsaD [Holosporaceae bacterium]
MYVLGIESSCDETASAIVTEQKKVLSNVIYSQISEHGAFGGVVPEIAARAHLEKIDLVVAKALKDAALDISEITAVAGTCGPGLMGGLIVGSTFAKTIAMAMNIPFIAANHIEAHALSIRLTEDVHFPYLLLLVSGGHCQLCVVHGVDRFEVLGKTIDDSVGEAFDKIAKFLGLGYPGGPALEKEAVNGNDQAFPLPSPLCRGKSCDFSFAGLKTAVLTASQGHKTAQDKADLCASFQKTAARILAYKTKQAIDVCRSKNIQLTVVVAAGGVASNEIVRRELRKVCSSCELSFSAPPARLCTDNGAMIAWLGVEKLRINQMHNLNFAPRPRWPMGE